MWDLGLKWGIWESDWYHKTYLAHAWLPAPREQGTRLHSLLCPPWYLGLGCGRVEVSRWIIHSLVGKQFGGPWSWEVTRIEGLQVSPSPGLWGTLFPGPNGSPRLSLLETQVQFGLFQECRPLKDSCLCLFPCWGWLSVPWGCWGIKWGRKGLVCREDRVPWGEAGLHPKAPGL